MLVCVVMRRARLDARLAGESDRLDRKGQRVLDGKPHSLHLSGRQGLAAHLL
jgi:hypothetical protein